MVSIRSLALSAAILAGLAVAAPSASKVGKKFHIRVEDPDSKLKLTNYYLETYHTGAGTADPTFTNANKGDIAFFNGTSILIDVSPAAYPFGFEVSIGDTNYARWEPTSFNVGYGSGNFVNNGPEGIQLGGDSAAEFGGWVICEWFHGINLPQLFVGVKGYDGNSGAGGPSNLPDTCANVLLFPEYI